MLLTRLSLNGKAQELLAYANEKRKTSSFSDIKIQVGNELFPANKMVLSCYSKYFETMFDIEMQERYRDVVEIHGFDNDVIKMLINFMYGEEIVINSNNVIQALAAADYLQLNDVKNFCIDFLQEGLTVDICLDALIAYDMYQPASPLDHVYIFISKHFHEVFQQEKLKQLSKIQLTSLITEMTKKVVHQELLFAAINSWIEKNKQTRKIYFAELFQLVAIEKLSCKCLEANILSSTWVKESKVCLDRALLVFSKKFKEMKEKEKNSKIIWLGERSSTELHDIFGNSLTTYPNLPTNVCWHSVQKAGKFIYCLGGTSNHNAKIGTADVYRMSVLHHRGNNGWEKMAPMNDKRCFHASAVINNKVITTGGVTDAGASSSTELYDSKRNNWQFLPPMNVRRSGHGLVACNESLIALGGCGDDDVPLSSVEILGEMKGNWNNLNPMNTPRNRLAAVACDGHVYAIGGKSPNGIESSVEKYDFCTGRWSFVCRMTNPRWGHSACVLYGRIFVVGGQTHTNYSNYVVMECYKPESNTWSSVPVRQGYQQRLTSEQLSGRALVVL